MGFERCGQGLASECRRPQSGRGMTRPDLAVRRLGWPGCVGMERLGIGGGGGRTTPAHSGSALVLEPRLTPAVEVALPCRLPDDVWTKACGMRSSESPGFYSKGLRRMWSHPRDL